MGGALVLGLDHVLLYALYEGLAAAGGTDAARAALNTQVLEQGPFRLSSRAMGSIAACCRVSHSHRVYITPSDCEDMTAT